MNECTGIAKGQGKFTQQYEADGGQNSRVNNLKGKLTAW